MNVSITFEKLFTQIITASGNVTVPDRATRAHVRLAGGGGGGGFGGRGGGGGAAQMIEFITDVNVGDVLPVVIGAGGLGHTTSGSDGSKSTFLNRIALPGQGGGGGATVLTPFLNGPMGIGHNSGNSAGGASVGFSGSDLGVDSFYMAGGGGGAKGGDSLYGSFTGGVAGTGANGGGGGGACLANGANGGNNGVAGANAPANSGSGGGGGGAGSGGNGGSGVLIITWLL